MAIDRFARDRNRFIAEAIENELVHSRREGFLWLLASAHPEASELVETRLSVRGASLRAGDEGLVDEADDYFGGIGVCHRTPTRVSRSSEKAMIPTNSIVRTLGAVVELLVRRDYAELERLTGGACLRASEIERGVRDYGRTIVLPPPEAFFHADVIPIRGAVPPAYSVRFRLYTQEEGLSDLELQATFVDDAHDETMRVEIDNIIVA